VQRLDYLWVVNSHVRVSKMTRFLLICAALLAASTALSQPRVYLISPADGSTVSSPVEVLFGLEGFGVAPAGTVKENTGHHHLIINAPLPDLTKPIPASDNYRHFGGGQTQTSVELPPGEHTLQLLMGDYAHMPHENPIVSEVVTITVE
jgi:hypothetical protein